MFRSAPSRLDDGAGYRTCTVARCVPPFWLRNSIVASPLPDTIHVAVRPARPGTP
jgi:hypothetical protein